MAEAIVKTPPRLPGFISSPRKSTRSASEPNTTAAKKLSTVSHLVAGATAGTMEALVCHPLDTLKVQMQLSRTSNNLVSQQRRGFLATGKHILQYEGAFGFYRGLSAVLTFIGPKMAIRFASFEWYKSLLAGKSAKSNPALNFSAGLAAGVTEAVFVVTPMDVVKIRLQSQRRIAGENVKYRSAAQTLLVVAREEGFKGLFSGVGLTAVRQGTNQAVSFTVYSYLKSTLEGRKNRSGESEALPMWQNLVVGLIAGAAGPCSNAPIDTVKTLLQKTPAVLGQSSLQRTKFIALDLLKREGIGAFYKGLLPRVMRVGPGQAVAYTVFEQVKKILA